MQRDWTNEAITQAILNNDSKLLSRFYQSLADQASSLFRTWGIPEDKHADILQDSFMSLCVNVKTGKYKVQETTKIESYLFQICKYQWYGKRRNKINTHTQYIGDQKEQERLALFNADDAFDEIFHEEDQRVQNLLKAIERLGDRCKKMLRMFYWDKSNMKLIADAFNMTIASAKNAKYRCMSRLRSELDAN